MPVNSRYTSGAFAKTSSLFKSVKSAASKVQQIEDATQKFLWDTNQISNDEYMSYAKKRIDSSTDTMDKISWSRSINGVQREINSDYRASVMLEISRTPGMTSEDELKKIEMFSKLYEQAYNDGDQDAMTSIETQYNNTVNAYKNKIESEARRGMSSAKNTINRAYNETKNQIDYTRSQIKQDDSLSPLEKAAAMAAQDILETKANMLRLSGAFDSDGNIDEVKVGDIQNSIMNLQGKVKENMKFFKGSVLDQNGEPYTGAEGQIIADFNPSMTVDPLGNKDFELSDNFVRVYEDGKEKLLDKTTGKIGGITYDFAGNPIMEQNSAQMEANGATTQTDEYGREVVVPKGYTMHTLDSGQTVVVKTQYDKYTSPESYDGKGQVIKEKTKGDVPQDVAYQMVPTGKDASGKTIFERRNWDPYTKNFTIATIDSNTQKSREDLNKSLIKNYNKSGMTAAEFTDPNKLLNAKRGVETAAMDLYSLAKAKTEMVNKELAKTKAIKDAQERYGASAMVGSVNPINGKYDQPKNFPAPYKLPTPGTDQLRNSQDVLSPGGFMAPIVNPGGKDVIGYKNGVEYWKVKKADGGYDYLKGDNFKISEGDAMFELGKASKAW